MVAESSVRQLVARLRVEIGGDRKQVMVPQTHPPAEEAEVDFGLLNHHTSITSNRR